MRSPARPALLPDPWLFAERRVITPAGSAVDRSPVAGVALLRRPSLGPQGRVRSFDAINPAQLGRPRSPVPSMPMRPKSALEAAVVDGDRDAAAAVFRALSTPNRLAVFDALTEQLTVPQLRVHLGALDPGRDLRVLCDAGLVKQLPGLMPRRWRQVPGAAAAVASILR